MLRGRAEHASLTWSNFRISKITSGKYLGRKKLEIVNLQDKCMHVSVKNPVRRDNSGCLDAVQCLENKHTYVVYWVIYYQTLCPPNQHWFYCYKAHQKLMKVSIRIFKSLRNLTLIYFFLYFIFSLQTYAQNKQKYMLNPNRPIGHNRLAQMAPEFAARCQF